MKCCVHEFHKFELWNEEIDAKIIAVKETNLCSCEKKKREKKSGLFACLNISTIVRNS